MSARASASRVGTFNGMTNAVTGKLSWSYAFEPSIAITTGRIDKLGADIRSFREPLRKAVKDVMTKSIYRNFMEGGRPAWEPLSEATWQTRTGKGWTGGGPLSLSGKLERGASRINIWEISATSATIRDLPQSIWYGKVHQAGMSTGGKAKARRGGFSSFIASGGSSAKSRNDSGNGRGYVNIPQREFLVIQDEDREAIIHIFEEWLGERVRRAMGRR